MGEANYLHNKRYPHLGYWLTAPFPGFAYYEQRDPDTPVLTDPKLDPWHTVFPYKVTFIEDMQQEDFWNVSVEKYGFSVFRSRALTNGARMEYKDIKTTSHLRGYRIP